MTLSRKSQAGFSLLELLVAFSIMALSLGLIYQSISASARNVGNLALYQQAAMLADSLLNSRDSVTDHGWNDAGTYASFNWQVSSEPFVSQITASELVPLHQIFITITWQDGGRQHRFNAQTMLPQRQPVPGELVR